MDPLSRHRPATPPELHVFFREIQANPTDDTPRLVLADWLVEHGDEAAAARGEFLRSSVLRWHLAREDPAWDRLKRREGEIFTRHRWAWLGPLANQARRWRFERGMLQIAARADRLLTAAVAAWSQTPAAWWVDSLTLSEMRTEHVPLLAGLRLVAHLTALDLGHNPRVADWQPLFRSHNLRRLPSLRLAYNWLGTGSLAALAHCPSLERLRTLDLERTRLEDDAARVLAGSPLLANLTALHLRGNHFSRCGVALLREVFGERVHL